MKRATLLPTKERAAQLLLLSILALTAGCCRPVETTISYPQLVLSALLKAQGSQAPIGPVSDVRATSGDLLRYYYDQQNHLHYFVFESTASIEKIGSISFKYGKANTSNQVLQASVPIQENALKKVPVPTKKFQGTNGFCEVDDPIYSDTPRLLTGTENKTIFRTLSCSIASFLDPSAYALSCPSDCVLDYRERYHAEFNLK